MAKTHEYENLNFSDPEVVFPLKIIFEYRKIATQDLQLLEGLLILKARDTRNLHIYGKQIILCDICWPNPQ